MKRTLKQTLLISVAAIALVAGANLADAQRSDKAAFARYFHACLDGGVYFAPSQFEAGFLSLTHTSADMARTAEVTARALLA